MTSKEILKSKLKLLRADKIFDKDKINKNVTLDQFKTFRANSYIPIEDYILKEYYGYERSWLWLV